MLHILGQPDTPDRVHYITQDPAQVQKFLTRHPAVEHWLRDATAPLQHTFGKDVTVSLTVVNNPAIASRELLVSNIQTALSVTQAKARLDKFDETWWLDNAQRAEGQLVFTLAFKK